MNKLNKFFIKKVQVDVDYDVLDPRNLNKNTGVIKLNFDEILKIPFFNVNKIEKVRLNVEKQLLGFFYKNASNENCVVISNKIPFEHVRELTLVSKENLIVASMQGIEPKIVRRVDFELT